MCCGPDHVGAPPEWHRELRDEDLPPGRGVSAATLAAWARLLGPWPGPRLVSTESGRGRAEPARWGHVIMPTPRPPARERERP